MPVSKNPYKRFSLIDNALRQENYPSMERLKQVLEDSGYPVSTSTIEKDIETMRSKFSMPVVYDRTKRGYAYSDENAYFDIPITEDDVETIWTALDKLTMFSNASAFVNVRNSLERIMSRLEIDLKRQNRFTEKIIFYEPLPDFAGSEWLPKLYDAICGCNPVLFKFESYDEQVNHLMYPYLLKEYSGRWYVIGKENDICVVYGLDRIKDLLVSNSLFAWDKDFYEMTSYQVELSMGMFDFHARHHSVLIGYDISLADEIKSIKFHENQKVFREDENEILIMMDVVIDEDFLKKAVLPYGDKARLYGPNFAISLLKRILIKTLDKYKND